MCLDLLGEKMFIHQSVLVLLSWLGVGNELVDPRSVRSMCEHASLGRDVSPSEELAESGFSGWSMGAEAAEAAEAVELSTSLNTVSVGVRVAAGLPMPAMEGLGQPEEGVVPSAGPGESQGLSDAD